MTGNVSSDLGYKTKADFTKYIQEHSNYRHDKLTKDSAYLVCNDTEGNSAKIKKAMKLGVSVITYTDFIESI
jgi:NAD-dependent DNA ligase